MLLEEGTFKHMEIGEVKVIGIKRGVGTNYVSDLKIMGEGEEAEEYTEVGEIVSGYKLYML